MLTGPCGLCGAIATRYAEHGSLPVITLDPQLEQALLESIRPAENGTYLAIDGALMEIVAGNVAQLSQAAEQRGVTPVLACSPALRPPLHRLVRSAGQSVPVLSYPEIAGFPARIETMGVVSGAYADRP